MPGQAELLRGSVVHRWPFTYGTYVRIDEAWADNSATQLGL
jgi:hypothetical protein